MMTIGQNQTEFGIAAPAARPSRTPRLVPALLALCTVIVSMIGPFSPTMSTVHAATTVAVACTPSLSSSALHVHPGEVVTLTGHCLTHGSPITIHWGSASGHTMESTSTNSTGGFAQNITIPSDATDGSTDVVALDGSGKSATYTLIIAVPVAGITLSKSKAAPSDSVTVGGHGFSAHSHVDFTLDDGTQLGSGTTTNAGGGFNVPVSLPLDIAGGPTNVTATDANGHTAMASLTITGGTSTSCDFWCSVATTFFGTILSIMLAPITALLLLIAKLVDASTGSLWSHTPPELSYGNATLQSFHTLMLALGAALIVLYIAYMGLMIVIKGQRSFGNEGPAEVIWRAIFTVGFMAASWEFFTWTIDLFNGLTAGLGATSFDSFFTQVGTSVKTSGPNQLLYVLLLMVMSIMIIILTVKMAIRLAYLDVVAVFMPLMSVFLMRPETSGVGKAWMKEYVGTLIAQFVTVATLKLGIGLMLTGMTMAMPTGGSPTVLGFILAIGVFVLAVQISKRFERVIGATGVHASPLTMLLGAAALQKGASGGAKAATALAGAVAAPHMAAAGAMKGFASAASAASAGGSGFGGAMASGAKGAASGAAGGLAKGGRMITGAQPPRPDGAAFGGGGGAAGGPGAAALTRAAAPVPLGGASALSSGMPGGVAPASNARAFAQGNPGLSGQDVGGQLLQNYQGQRDPSFTTRNGNALSRKEIPSFVEAAGYDPSSNEGQQFQSYLNQHEDAGTLTPENVGASFAAVAADEGAGTTPPDLGSIQAQELPTAASIAAMGGEAALARSGYTPTAAASAAAASAGGPSLAGMAGSQAWQAWAPSRSHSQAAAARGNNVMGRKEIGSFVAAAGHAPDSDAGKQLSYYLGKHENAGTLSADNLGASVDATNLDAAAGATPTWGHGVQSQQAPTAQMAQAYGALPVGDASKGWSANYGALATAAPAARSGSSPATGMGGSSSASTGTSGGGGGSTTVPYTPSGGSASYSSTPWQMPANLAAANQRTMGSWAVGGMAWSQHTRQAGSPGVAVSDHFNPALPESDLRSRASSFAQSFGYGDNAPATEAIADNVMTHAKAGSLNEDNIRAVGAMAVEDQWAGRLATPTRGAITHADLGRAATPRAGTGTP